MEESKKHRERQFHNAEYLDPARDPVQKYHSITESIHRRYEQILTTSARDRRVLDFGCGRGQDALTVAKHGAKVVAFDISDVAIQLAKEEARKRGLEGGIIFFVGDCEYLALRNDSVELVYGNAILHHADIPKALQEIARVLKTDGTALFLEPLGHNPAINLFRKLTPQFRSPDEHPLRSEDLDQLKEYFYEVRCNFYYLFSLMAVPFRNRALFSPILALLERWDEKVFNWIPSLRLLAWLVLIECRKPKK